MNKRRINELANFFFHADNANEVPFRISIIAGMAGQDLDAQKFKELLYLLENSENLFEDTNNFWNENYNAPV